MKDQITTPRTFATDEAARYFHVQGQSLRAAVCRNGHYMGIRPLKLPNRLLAWPADEVMRVAAGEAAQ